jgi:hypothetical protein
MINEMPLGGRDGRGVGFQLRHGHFPVRGTLVAHLHLGEAGSRMESGEAEYGDEAHATHHISQANSTVHPVREYLHSIQHDEFGFVLHDGIPPPTGHLGDTVNASDEDDKVCGEEGSHEELESHVREKVDDRLTEFVPALEGGPGVLSGQDAKDEQGEDLEHDTGHHEVITNGCVGVGIRGRGQSSAGALQDQGEEIT